MLTNCTIIYVLSDKNLGIQTGLVAVVEYLCTVSETNLCNVYNKIKKYFYHLTMKINA